MSDERCMAVMGNVHTGALYCGNRAKGHDANGRPCCGIHLGKQHGIEWWGDRRAYPHGTAGRWQWNLLSLRKAAPAPPIQREPKEDR